MSTTYKYNAIFLLPIAMTDTPLEFSILHKGFDEQGVDLGYYTYNEYMALDGNKAFYTPSNTHALLSENITSLYLKEEIEASLVGTPFVFKDGKDVASWTDLDQTFYIWCITTDPRMSFNYDEFIKVSPLYTGGQV